jgi:polar amino acid transport system permease protein
MSDRTDLKTPIATQSAVTNTLAGLPWWLLIIMLAAVFMVYAFYTDETYQAIFDFLKSGIMVTIRVTMIAYAIAITIGLLMGLARVSKNPVIYNLATVYVQVMRGLPILVTI